MQQFEQWNEQVEDTIFNSSELKSIDRNDFFFDYEYDRRRVEIANLYAYQSLDEKYKLPSDPTVEQMRQTMEHNMEWPRMQWEQPPHNHYQVSVPEYKDIRDIEEDVLPF